MNIFLWKRKKKPKEKIEPERSEDNLPLPVPAVRKLSYAVANVQGIGRRSRQEDSFAFVNALDVTEIAEKGLFAIVADGMGGMKDGKIASESAISSLKESFAELEYEDDLAEQLLEGVLRAGEEVYENLGGDGGSTAVVCMCYDEKLYFVSVGDSFLYLKRNDQLYRLNREHNVLQQKYMQTIRRGSADPIPAQQSEEKAALTQFLGMNFLDDVDYLRKPFALQDKDVLLLCSDGVGGVLSQEDILSCLSLSSPSEICEEIERRIQRENRTYQDNYTALIIWCEK